MPLDPWQLDSRPSTKASYDTALAQMEREMIRGVNDEMRGQDARQVHEVLVTRFKGRLPGAQMDDRNLQKIAAAISEGTLIL